MQNVITVQTTVSAPIKKVWECWTKPDHIVGWAFATNDWEAKDPQNDVRVGGSFKTTMAAKDNSESFDFSGTYTQVEVNKLLEFDMDDGRHVRVEFKEINGVVEVTESFEPEKDNPVEMQQAGWQAILDNFKLYVEKTEPWSDS